MDEAILRTVNALSASPTVADLGRFLSSYWVPVLTLTPLAVVLLRAKRFWAVLSIALAMGTGDRLNSGVVKPLVGRARPCTVLEGLEQPVSCGPGKSFASGHAVVAFAFLVSASPTVRFGWAIFTPIAVLTSGSRVLLGVHYPSDVAGGAVMGSLIGALFLFGRGYLERRLGAARGGVKGAQKAQPSSP
jgi:undecaprenyl-diphosphatase